MTQNPVCIKSSQLEVRNVQNEVCIELSMSNSRVCSKSSMYSIQYIVDPMFARDAQFGRATPTLGCSKAALRYYKRTDIDFRLIL